jgi:uncharacterized protein (DUF2336 family)
MSDSIPEHVMAAAAREEKLASAIIDLICDSEQDPAIVTYALTNALARTIIVGHENPLAFVAHIVDVLRTIIERSLKPEPGEAVH